MHIRVSGLLASTIVLLALTASSPAGAQAPTDDRARVLAIADSALAAINRGDPIALTDLMIDSAIIVSIRAGDSTRHSARSRATERARPIRSGVVERGFRPEVHVSGPLAVVWLPYDLYIDGNWSHCGVDTFMLVRTAGVWKIASTAWSVEQPPACARHPDGPPRR